MLTVVPARAGCWAMSEARIDLARDDSSPREPPGSFDPDEEPLPELDFFLTVRFTVDLVEVDLRCVELGAVLAVRPEDGRRDAARGELGAASPPSSRTDVALGFGAGIGAVRFGSAEESDRAAGTSESANFCAEFVSSMPDTRDRETGGA